MAAFDYASIASKADALIARFGKTTAIRRYADSTSTDWDSTRTHTDHACKAAVVDYTNSEVDGTNILTGDRQALVSPVGLDIDPAPGDAFLWEGVAHKIIVPKKVDPADGSVALWMLQVRR